jgi:hypothetical protein
MNTEKKGIEFITNLWSSVIELKDAAFINIKARQLRKESRNAIVNLIKEIENDTDLFQDNLEKMAVDSVDYSFKYFNDINKRILLNSKELEISKNTYKKLFNEDYES